MKLKVTRKTHTRSERGRAVTYRVGESFDGSEKEFKAFSDRLEQGYKKKVAKKKDVSHAATDDDGSAGDSSDAS